MLEAALDRRIMIERFGSGRPQVLALHGWGRGREDWTRVISDFAAYAPDLPGFGLSPAPPTDWGTRDYAEFLAPLVAEMRKPIVVVGHSFGGRIAVRLGELLPDAISGLVLTGAPLIRSRVPRKPPIAYRAIRTLHRAGILRPAVLDRARERYGSVDYRAATGIMRQVFVRVVNETYDASLARLTCPVALVWGARDTEVPPVVAESVAAALASRPSIGETPVTTSFVADSGHAIDASLAGELKSTLTRMLEAAR